MPVTVSYPGVYVEELPSGTRTVTGVSTAITAFVGRAARGPVDKAILVHSFTGYERTFGGLAKYSKMSYAVNQYFQNGGAAAIITRVHNGAATASYNTGSDNLALTFEAANPGTWGNNLTITMDPVNINTEDDDASRLFNLNIVDNKTQVIENYLNLSINENSPRFVKDVLEQESSLIRFPGDVPQDVEVGDVVLVLVLDDANKGADGDLLTSNNVKGSEASKTGIYSLDNTDLFNMLCIPPDTKDDTHLQAAYTDALSYCKSKRAILLIDPPSTWNDKDDAKLGIDNTAERGQYKNENAAIFFPHLTMRNSLNDNKLETFAPCGAVAGVIARNDGQRGVWKAPAGIEATLAGVSDLQVRLTDKENGVLNPMGINCLRILPGMGAVVWGSRTMRGADILADQWKYLPVRRTALYIEESLYRGTQWVVFEPNDEPLWSQIRLNIGAFMHDLFIKGAFQGTNPKDAYLVKCDKETTTQYDIDRGIVNILVGFAPLKPAEFVILKIQQLAGQEKK